MQVFLLFLSFLVLGLLLAPFAEFHQLNLAFNFLLILA
jgi:hypothetical protein